MAKSLTGMPQTTDNLLPVSLTACPVGQPSMSATGIQFADEIPTEIESNEASLTAVCQLRDRQWEYDHLLRRSARALQGGKKRGGIRCLVQWSPVWLSSDDASVAMQIWGPAKILAEKLV